jgi:maltose alpha-D-glucosyltransferase/alpha-amylase
MLAMVHRLDDGCLQVTALNFSGQPVAGSVASTHLPPGATVTDMSSGQRVGVVDHMHRVNVSLGPYHGRSLALADPR